MEAKGEGLPLTRPASVKDLIHFFGIPLNIKSDNGPHFRAMVASGRSKGPADYLEATHTLEPQG